MVAILLLAAVGTGHAATARDPQSYAASLRDELAIYAKSGESRNLTAVLQLGQQFIKDPQALPAFRAAIDVGVASSIVSAASSSDRPLRIAAARLLVDLVDNRTMCAVADVLMEAELDADARYNFLQILRVANRYAMAENRTWNGHAIEVVKASLSSDKATGDVSKTLAIVATIEDEQGKFASRANLLIFRREQPDSYAACRKLANIAQLTAENAPYTVYFHTRRPAGEIEAAKAGLEGLGFVVAGTDGDTDAVGGFGIDYGMAPDELQDPGQIMRTKADMIGGTLSATLKAAIPSRPQSRTPRGAFGVWF